MPKPYLVKISQSIDFYRSNYRFLLKLAIFLLILIFVELGFLFYDHFTEPTLQYFITTSSGQVIELDPETR